MSIGKLLANVDVLHVLFDQLRPIQHVPPPGSEDVIALEDLYHEMGDLRTTLASAALTCKAFAEPASRVLWSVVDGLRPLVPLICDSDALADSGDALQDEIYPIMFEGDPSDIDWARLDRITARVKCVLYNPYRSLDSSFLDVLIKRYDWQRGIRPGLFPNLRCLGWPTMQDSEEGDWLPVLFMFCSPTLEYLLVLEFDDCPPDSEQLSMIATLSPNIRHLKAELAAMPLGADSPVYGCGALRTLMVSDCSRIDEALFVHISRLPHLEILGVGTVVLPAPTGTRAGHARVRDTFPSIRKLWLCISTLDPRALLHTLSRISSPRMEALSLSIAVVNKDETVQFIQELCSLAAALPLMDLCLFAHAPPVWPDDGTPPRGTLAFAAVAAPLFSLRRIEHLTIHFSCPVDVTDDDVARIGAAWPRLTHISLQGTWDASPSVRPSLHALVALAERCPDIKELELEAADITEAEVARLEERLRLRGGSRDRDSAVEKLGLERNDKTEPICFVGDADELHDRLARVVGHFFPHLREDETIRGLLGRPVQEREGTPA